MTGYYTDLFWKTRQRKPDTSMYGLKEENYCSGRKEELTLYVFSQKKTSPHILSNYRKFKYILSIHYKIFVLTTNGQ